MAARGTTPYLLKGYRSSAVAARAEGGNRVESSRYDPWGRTTVYDGNGNLLSESAVGNRYGFQGREISWRTGLYYFRARWPCPSVASGEGGYDPVTGRWLSNDPIGISGGLNQYVFCGDNALDRTDPYGEGGWFAVGAAVAGVAAVAVDLATLYVNAPGGPKALTLPHVGTFTGRHYRSLGGPARFVVDMHENVHYEGDWDETCAWVLTYRLTKRILEKWRNYLHVASSTGNSSKGPL